MLLFSPAPSVDCNWDGKLWVTCLCMSFFKSSYSGANFSLTRHAGHTLKYTNCTLLCTNKALSSSCCSSWHPTPPALSTHTYTHHLHQTPLPLLRSKDSPSQSIVKICLSHGQLAKANKPATCQLMRAWTGSGGGGLLGGSRSDRGRDMVTQRKQAQQEQASLLTQGPRHVSCHATATPSTQIRADGSNKAKEQRRRMRGAKQSPPCPQSV